MYFLNIKSWNVTIFTFTQVNVNCFSFNW
jgi:hypothetical protein